METRNPSISPLRQRMIEDMRMRKFGEKTQTHYLRAVRQFAKYLGRSPDPVHVACGFESAVQNQSHDLTPHTVWGVRRHRVGALGRIAESQVKRPGELTFQAFSY